MNCLILGSGKIGIDLYIKCKRSKFFKNISIFNRNRFSVGAKYCLKNNLNYFDTGIKGLINSIDLKKVNLIYDATSAEASINNYKLLKPFLKKNFYINLTPSDIGEYTVPYHSLKNKSKCINLITCGGQSSIPLIIELKKVLPDLIYTELVSSISSESAGPATRKNINEYIENTQSAISKLTGIKKNKVIINLNPSNPPVNMMNSIFFEYKKKLQKIDFVKISKVLKKINKNIKFYIPGFNGKFFKTGSENFFRITIRVVGQGDYLPSYAGNLDIITSAAAYLPKLIYEKNYY
jgi:acetaldehyde dehydrogenase (acetylating)